MHNDEFLKKYSYRLISLAAATILLTGTVFYHFVEKLSWLDAWYLSVITLTTVGYGDIAPQTDAGKLFTTFYVLTGIGIIVTFTSTLVKRVGDRRNNRNKE